jgi:hypothetical protein
MLIVRGAISIDAYLWMLNDRLPLPFRGCLVRDALLSANEFVFFIFFNSLDTFILGRCLHSLMLIFFDATSFDAVLFDALIQRGATSIDAYKSMLTDRLPLPFRGSFAFYKPFLFSLH